MATVTKLDAGMDRIAVAYQVTCPKCFADIERKCYYINQGGNHTYLHRPHKERIEISGGARVQGI